MLHVHAEIRAVGGDAREPLAHAGKQLDGLARADQIIAVETDALRGALADHGVHIGEQAVHFVLIAEAVGLGPELRGRVDFIFPADYREGTEFDKTVHNILRKMAVSDALSEKNAEQLRAIGQGDDPDQVMLF